MAQPTSREALGEVATFWTAALMKKFCSKVEEASRWAGLMYETELLAVVDGGFRLVFIQEYPDAVRLRLPSAVCGVTPNHRPPQDFWDEWGVYAIEEGRCRAEASFLLLELRDYWVASSLKNPEPWGDFNVHYEHREEDPGFFWWAMSLMPPELHPWTFDLNRRAAWWEAQDWASDESPETVNSSPEDPANGEDEVPETALDPLLGGE